MSMECISVIVLMRNFEVPEGREFLDHKKPVMPGVLRLKADGKSTSLNDRKITFIYDL